MAQNGKKEDLTWHDVNADDLPPNVRKLLDALIAAEAKFKDELEVALKKAGHMPEGTRLIMSRKRERIGVAFAKSGVGGGSRLQFK